MLDQAFREVLVQGGINFLGHNMVDPVGPGSARCATFLDRNLERRQGAGTKIRLVLGEHVRNITENITQLFDCRWGSVRAVQIKCNRVQM